MVRTSTRAASPLVTISFVAVTRRVSGMSRSMTTTSGLNRSAIVDRLATGFGFADDLDVLGRAKHRAQTSAHDHVVVGEDDSDEVVGHIHSNLQRGARRLVGRSARYGGTAPRSGLDLESAVDQIDPLAASTIAPYPTRALRLGEIESDPVVVHARASPRSCAD